MIIKEFQHVFNGTASERERVQQLKVEEERGENIQPNEKRISHITIQLFSYVIKNKSKNSLKKRDCLNFHVL